MNDIKEQLKKIDELSRKTLLMSRNTLLVNLRFLDRSLSMLKYHPTMKTTVATDGEYLFYNGRHVLQRYKAEKEAVVHDYLHMVMHCVFRHMFVHTLIDQACWNLACDIAVEYAIYGLGLKSAKINREVLQESVFERLKKAGVMITAEKLYRYYLDQNLKPEKIAELRGAFLADDHEPWYMTEDEKNGLYGITGKGVSDPNGSNPENGEGESNEPGTGISVSVNMNASMTEQEWKDISEQIQMDMETFSRLKGDQAGSFIQNLKEVNREKYDYTSFLKKFAVMGEVMKINDDEFDYIFYTYGLRLYEKVPLIEPLEYKDVKRIKEFVIAIDTSGSTSGELIQKFIQKTYNILKSTESFFSRINLHIIQCDAEIQEDAKITNQEEFDEYLKHMKIRGLGGTDFRPVFKHVEKMKENKEFTNLKGLIYFTDGYGNFPCTKPSFETAFVFVEEEYINPEVPPWAIRLVLQKDEI